MTQEVVSFKLDTGEEVVAKVEKWEHDHVILDRPRAIALMPGRNGQMGMTLVPFMASNQDGQVQLERAHVVASTKPHDDLEKGYLQSTTNIQLVTK